MAPPARATPTLSLYCQGLNQSSSGTAKNAALINLHLATGQIGKPGAGPFSLTGQPNAMGGREVGGLANLLSGHRDLANPAHRAEVAALWGVPSVPDKPGKTAVEMFQAAADGEIKACGSPAPTRPRACPTRPPCAARCSAPSSWWCRRPSPPPPPATMPTCCCPPPPGARKDRHRHQQRAAHQPGARGRRPAQGRRQRTTRPAMTGRSRWTSRGGWSGCCRLALRLSPGPSMGPRTGPDRRCPSKACFPTAPPNPSGTNTANPPGGATWTSPA
jgi:hypothetical protein